MKGEDQVLGDLRAMKGPTAAILAEVADEFAAILAEVGAERVRQQTQEGHDLEHDNRHDYGELARHAAALALGAAADQVPSDNPLRRVLGRRAAEAAPWPIKSHGGRRDLVQAAALIVAEIARRDRRGGGRA